MKAVAVLLVTAGLVSALNVPLEARQSNLVARQEAEVEDAEVDEVEVEEDVEVEDEAEVDDAEVEDVEVEEEEEEEEDVDIDVDVEDFDIDDILDLDAEDEIADLLADFNFNDFFNLNEDLVGLEDFDIQDILDLDDIDLQEAQLADAIFALMSSLGLGNILAVDDIVNFGLAGELALFFRLQMLQELQLLGFINQFEALALIQQGLIFGGGVNAFNLGFGGVNNLFGGVGVNSFGIFKRGVNDLWQSQDKTARRDFNERMRARAETLKLERHQA